MKPRRRLVEEKDGVRGLVPTGSDAHLDQEYSRYLEEIKLDSDQSLRGALAASPDIRFRELLRYLALPSAAKHPLVYWVKRAGIDMSEMIAWVSKAQGAKALAVAQAAAPRINEALAKVAELRYIACGRCDGFGWVAAEAGLPEDTPGYRILRQDVETGKDVWIRTCPNGCDKGKLCEPGNEFAQEKLLEQTGAINRRGGGLQIIQNFGGQSMPSAVARLDALTIDIDPG